VGATAERVGFDPAITSDGIARLTRTAAEIIPDFRTVEPVHAWAGLRPISADLQPILGPDPDEPRLLYATGHSRNGILMTPLTGDCVGALLVGQATPASITEFSIARFDATSRGAASSEPSTRR
jgi:glycine oxidase